MGFLHKLWDETLAGPTPETGLGKLRKYNSFSGVRSSSPITTDDVPVSRTITILKTHSSFRNISDDSGSDPNSPAGSSAPGSPFSPGMPRGDFKRLTGKKKEAYKNGDPRSPTAYDWIVISALDR